MITSFFKKDKKSVSNGVLVKRKESLSKPVTTYSRKRREPAGEQKKPTLDVKKIKLQPTSNTSTTTTTTSSPSSPLSSSSSSSSLSSQPTSSSSSLQMFLDAGQKDLTHTVCAKCKMVYSPGNPRDERDHQLFCQSHLDLPRLVKWQSRFPANQVADNVVRVCSDDNEGLAPKPLLDRARLVARAIDQLLGSPDDDAAPATATVENRGVGGGGGEQYFLYLNGAGSILGCFVAEPCREARAARLRADVVTVDQLEVQKQATDEPEPVVVGLSRIWVHPEHRRQGIALRLLDAVRRSFLYTGSVNYSQLAFTQPTSDGFAFIRAVMLNNNLSRILIYK